MTKRPAAGRAEWNERSHVPGAWFGVVRAVGAGLARRVAGVLAGRLVVCLAGAAGLAGFFRGRVRVAAESRSKGRSQRLDFFLGMDESRAVDMRHGMRHSHAAC
nr:hypothetical protein [Burkholderia anthina]